MIEIKDEDALNKHLASSPKVVALFFATWCPFCRSFLSVFNKHSDVEDGLGFIRVQVDDYENSLWETYSLEAVPSIILFEKGIVSRRLDCEQGKGLTEKQFVNWLAAAVRR